LILLTKRKQGGKEKAFLTIHKQLSLPRESKPIQASFKGRKEGRKDLTQHSSL
jgi:hypothetical protein